MPKHVLIYGSSGALGKTLVSLFKKQNYKISAIDFSENLECDRTFVVKGMDGPTVYEMVSKGLGTEKLDSIINVAGGWAGGNIHDDNLIGNVDLMYSQSVVTSIVAAKLGGKFLKEGGLLVLTGAAAALSATPGMIAYGMAKASVHHLISSCAAPDSGLPLNSRTIGICPVMLDTPANRKYAAPDADFSTWTPLSEIASKLLDWSEGGECQSGKLYKIVTKDGKTEFIVRK